ncbi:hypothetical protein AKJ09_02032 [Labilithrix luteola]|uniref:Lipoprotein n=1 Tax=Labilithrix luteola TaxID=1391654 RepID=A0A0K1PPB6_9BACT|nr:hypothetical protein [Labilithrix luteola]AKU95368.1 hypothetical protein AKJ09_02032 [Labilithrix luteola]
MRSLAVTTLVCAVCGVLSSGCSFLFVKGPPDNVEKLPAKAPVECTTSQLAPVVDVLVTTFQVVRTIHTASPKSDYRNFPISRRTDMAFGIGFSAAFGLSAIYGFAKTDACEDAKAAAIARRKRESVFSDKTPSTPSRVEPAPAEIPATESPSAPTTSEDTPTQ